MTMPVIDKLLSIEIVKRFWHGEIDLFLPSVTEELKLKMACFRDFPFLIITCCDKKLNNPAYLTLTSCAVFSDDDVEIEMVEEEAPFLRGHGRQGVDLSPVKIVKVRGTFWRKLKNLE